MKKNLLIKIVCVAAVAIAISGCTTKKKKKKCDTCPKWGYVVNNEVAKLA